MTKHNLILLILAGLLFLAGYITKTSMQKSEVESALLKKIERKANKDKRKEMSPNQSNSRKIKKQKKQAYQLEQKATNKNNNQKSNQTNEEKQQRKKDRRIKKIDKNFSDKTWWNKKGGSKVEAMNLTDETKALMDEQVTGLLKKRTELGMQLSQLHAITQQSLADGDLAKIQQSLENIRHLENTWSEEKQAVILAIIRNLSSEQLIYLSQSKEDISTLNWFDYNLTKGIERQSKKSKRINPNKNNSDI